MTNYKKFIIEINERDFKEIKNRCVDSDVNLDDLKIDENVIIQGMFHIDFGKYGELDLRDDIKIKKIE